MGNIREKFGHGSEVEKKVFDCFCQCLEYAKGKNILILFEPINLYLTYFICTLDEGAGFINRLGYKNLELIPDTHHMAMEEKSIKQSLIKHTGLFHYIHFSDSNRQAPGFGNINFKNIVEILKQQEFNGVISFEILPVPDDISAAKQAIEFLKTLL